MREKAFVAGVGMAPFCKPGASDPYDVMAATAVRKALDNAGLGYDAVEQAIAGYVYGDSTSGQRAWIASKVSSASTFSMVMPARANLCLR